MITREQATSLERGTLIKRANGNILPLYKVVVTNRGEVYLVVRTRDHFKQRFIDIHWLPESCSVLEKLNKGSEKI